MSRAAVPPSATPPPAPVAADPLSVAELADLVHEAATPLQQDLVVVVRTHPDHLDLALWPIGGHGPSPTDVLIGWRPDPGVRAVGLVSAGQEYGPAHQGPVAVTVLADTDGAAATVLERPGAEPILLAEQPQGWGADALRRTLGLPTPAPEHPVSACVEATWIAHLAALAWPAGIDRLPPLTWEQVARVHPLADPCGAVPTPQALAHSTCSLDRESSWSRLLQSVATEITGATPSPPGGRTVPLAAWFDQGSFSRWMLRQQPDTDQVLLDLLDHLTDHAAEQLLAALISL